jgi:hypothetical protein
MIKGYADLGDFDEDERIEKIGQAALSGKQTSEDKPLIIGFVVDDDGGTKGDRYIRKLQGAFRQFALSTGTKALSQRPN